MDEGKTTIAPEVITTIARLTTLSVEGVSRMVHRGFTDGVRLDVQEGVVSADLYVILKNGVNIREVSRNVQQQVGRAISEMVGMQVGRLNIHIEDIEYPGESED